MPSSIPTVKAAIITHLQAESGLAGLLVSYGLPWPTPPAKEGVYFGGTQDGDPTKSSGSLGGGGQQSASLGRRAREERYLLDSVVVVTQDARAAQQVVTERAFEIAAVIETSLRVWDPSDSSWPVPPGGSVHWMLITSVEHAEGKDNQNTQAAVHIQIAVAARI